MRKPVNIQIATVAMNASARVGPATQNAACHLNSRYDDADILRFKVKAGAVCCARRAILADHDWLAAQPFHQADSPSV